MSKAREAAARAADDYFSGADRAYGEHVKCANAAIDAFLAALKADGYKLVRRDVTDPDAIQAGCTAYAFERADDPIQTNGDRVRKAFAAMWDAAPEALTEVKS